MEITRKLSHHPRLSLWQEMEQFHKVPSVSGAGEEHTKRIRNVLPQMPPVGTVGEKAIMKSFVNRNFVKETRRKRMEVFQWRKSEESSQP